MTMRARTRTAAAITITALLLLAGPAPAQVAGSGVNEAVTYLQSRQNADGGFSEPGAGSDDSLTGWAVLAGVSGTDNPASLISFGAHALSYFSAQAPSITELRQIELCVLALSEVGLDPRNVQGRDMVALLKAGAGSDGRIGKSIEEHCWGIIALVAAKEKLPSGATEWLVSKQRADGGWGESDAVLISSTALAVEALVAAGEADADMVEPAMELLMSRMNGDGGFSALFNRASTTQLTATVVRAILAAGEDPASEDWAIQGLNPIVFMKSMQVADGHFQYSKGVDSEPALTTAMAVPALKGRHFPLRSASMPANGNDPAPVDSRSPVEKSVTTGADISPESAAAAQPAQSGEEAQSGESPSLAASDGQSERSSGDSYSSGIKAGAVARRAGWFSGVWLFTALCAAYLAFVAGAAIVASRLAEQRSTRHP